MTKQEFKKALRPQLKDKAIMKYGKFIKELSNCEIKSSLNEILKENLSYWKHANYGTTEEYKQLFKETFPKELKISKKVQDCKK